MRVISKSRLIEFWTRFPDARDPLTRFHDIAVSANWRNPADVKAALSKVDPVIVDSGRTVIVVNIGGNKYRLIMAVHYDKQRLFVLRVLTHREYDDNRWKEEL